MNPREIKLDECSVVMTSPARYDECIVEVETAEELLFILTDEQRTGACVVELPGDSETIARRISLASLRALLDAAEQKLLAPPT